MLFLSALIFLYYTIFTWVCIGGEVYGLRLSIEETPSLITTDIIELFTLFHGTSDEFSQSCISPLPEMVSVPVSSSDQIRFVPQVP